MNILTGILFCVFVIFYFAAQSGSASRKTVEEYAHIAAFSLLGLILLCGHWIAVLLGRL